MVKQVYPRGWTVHVIMCYGARKCHMYKTFKQVVNQRKGGPEKEAAEAKRNLRVNNMKRHSDSIWWQSGLRPLCGIDKASYDSMHRLTGFGAQWPMLSSSQCTLEIG